MDIQNPKIEEVLVTYEPKPRNRKDAPFRYTRCFYTKSGEYYGAYDPYSVSIEDVMDFIKAKFSKHPNAKQWATEYFVDGVEHDQAPGFESLSDYADKWCSQIFRSGIELDEVGTENEEIEKQ